MQKIRNSSSTSYFYQETSIVIVYDLCGVIMYIILLKCRWSTTYVIHYVVYNNDFNVCFILSVYERNVYETHIL